MQAILGKDVRDSVSGFAGVATARAEYLHGPSRVQIERRGDAEPRWFDEARVEIESIQTRPPVASAT